MTVIPSSGVPLVFTKTSPRGSSCQWSWADKRPRSCPIRWARSASSTSVGRATHPIIRGRLELDEDQLAADTLKRLADGAELLPLEGAPILANRRRRSTEREQADGLDALTQRLSSRLAALNASAVPKPSVESGSPPELRALARLGSQRGQTTASFAGHGFGNRPDEVGVGARGLVHSHRRWPG